jgi:glycosyltransferase involved in cell wall biosynthesis
VTCTGANVQHLRSIAPEARVHLVYHGLNDDLRRLVESNGDRPVRNGTLRLLGVGRLVEKKGFDTFVEACAALRDRSVRFEAAIAGPDGPHGPVVRRRIAKLGLEDAVRLVGPMSQEELLREYMAADALCLPCRVVGSDRDGIPNVLVEAMACGTPVVTTGISGIPELVCDGVDGLIVPPRTHAPSPTRCSACTTIALSLRGSAPPRARRCASASTAAASRGASCTCSRRRSSR